MAVISMKALLESGVHFGHRTNKWDPRMKPYIFTERNGIHIIDLQQTVKLLNQGYNTIRDTVANGGIVCSLVPNARRKRLWPKKPLAAVCPTSLNAGWVVCSRTGLPCTSVFRNWNALRNCAIW